MHKKIAACLYAKRKTKLVSILKRENCGCLLVGKKENIFYLTGLEIDDALLAVGSDGKTVIFSDPRYKLELSKSCVGSTLASYKIYDNINEPFLKFLSSKLKEENLSKIAVEDSFAFYAAEGLRKYLPGLKSIHRAVETVRKIKDEAEISSIKKAVGITRMALYNIKPKIKSGIREEKIAFEIEKFVLETSCAKAHLAFKTLVTSSSRIALPHGLPSLRKIKTGESVLIDMGIKIDGYNSDLTRMFAVGKISNYSKKIIRILKDAQSFAIEKVKPGVKANTIDKVARDFIGKKGYGKFFTHGTGHGVGLEVHEGPAITPKNKELLKAGMVFTVEPAIYMPNMGGGRVEDMVLVREKGCEVIK